MFKFKFRQFSLPALIMQTQKMSQSYEGQIAIKANQLNLDLTLLGGQSFRWRKVQHSDNNVPDWRGVAYDAFWILTQNAGAVKYKVHPLPTADVKKPRHYQQLLERYLRTDFDLTTHVAEWKQAHKHFEQIASDMKAVRVLDQEPLENILAFICSQNNHIKRISNMIEWLCGEYGQAIGEIDGRIEHTFPTLQTLIQKQTKLEESLRNAKFGYRAKFIAQTVAKISEYGGDSWFEKLRQLPYAEARLELVTLPGIGFKVADCICLMSLGHLESVPIDTHIYKIAQSSYMPNLATVKTVTPKIYDEVANHFRTVYGPAAGWAQAVLFCSDLQQFQEKNDASDSQKNENKKCAKKRRK